VTYHHQQWQRTVVLQIPIVGHLLYRNSTSPFHNIQNHSFFQLKIELNIGEFKKISVIKEIGVCNSVFCYTDIKNWKKPCKRIN
jgi:hypothetical protein